MTPTEILDFFKTLVDDAPDEESSFILMDTAYTKRNDARFWSFLLKLNTSITHGVSDTWLTTKTLPADFSEPYKVFGGASDNEYDPVPFENVLTYISAFNKYTIDYANLQMRFTGGASSALTVYLWYKYFPTSLIGLTTAQKVSETTIVWPKRFCPILAYDMAEMYFGGIEADEITRQMTPFQRQAHKELTRAMIQWDARRRMKMFGDSAIQQRTGHSERPDVLNW